MDPEADGINFSEIARRCGQRLEGGKSISKPIRKRGYYRALKSGKQWALNEKASRDLINSCMESLYRVFDEQVRPSRMFGLSQWLNLYGDKIK